MYEPPRLSIDGAAPGDVLRAVVALRQLADELEDEYVGRALEGGWPWARVAEALNVTRQAVHKKHARRLGDLGRLPSRRRSG